MSVEFSFDADNPSWKASYPDPSHLVHTLWAILGPTAQVNDLADACSLAAHGGLYYDALKVWAIANRTKVTADEKVMIFDALMRKPPSRGKDKHAHRNYKIHAISTVLRNEYGMTWAEVDTMLVRELPIHIDIEMLRSLRKGRISTTF